MTLNIFRTSSEPLTPGVVDPPSARLTFNLRVSVNDTGTVEVWPFHPHWDWFEFGREVVGALIRERTFLSYQLSYAKGLLGDEDFQEQVKRYLVEPDEVPDLEIKALRLSELVPEHVDSELVATVFRCSVSAAEHALAAAARQLRFPFTTPSESLRQLLTEQARVDH